MEKKRFPKHARLLRPSEFDQVFKARASASDAWLVLYGRENELGHPRLGLAVSQRGRSSVIRNRWKRLLREAFRLSQRDLPPFDLVCVPKVATAPGLAQLMASLPALARRVAQRIARSDQMEQANDSPWRPEV